MTKNLGDADRTARLLLGAIFAFLFANHRIGGAAHVALGVGAVFLLFTVLVGWCPLYALLRISTRKPQDTLSVKR